MNDTADSGLQSISLLKRQISFIYTIDPQKEEIAVRYRVYLTDGEAANETPIMFFIKKCDKQWQTGSYINEVFIPEEDIISESITDVIVQQATFFSRADKMRRWQRFSLDNAHGKFRFSDKLNAYQVVYKQRIGFLENSDDIVEEQEFIIIEMGREWLTCTVLAENGREIFSSLVTNEIKDYILQMS
ncbi:hypothetical protein [Mucilaginibacter boryungensis]|uniref:Uncharacterized protein n=1 Tax=Mucilaginibacter boryungensis TaxID=768480 RepID=A0ABR9XMH3_9SPHI|nr:hypothetical protein [Mucilaginibacter boryungensis]MBE9668143.1 hypothetical protein [Mucilaginibacter boryungensis]